MSVSGPRLPRRPAPHRDKRASTRWSYCSTAANRRRVKSRATWCAGGITHSPTTIGSRGGHCREKVAEYDAAALHRRVGRRDAPPLPPRHPAVAAAAAAPPLVVASAGFRLPTPAEVATGPALLGRTVLYYLLGDGWVSRTVARLSRILGFSHVVRYGPRSALPRWAPRWSTRTSMPPRTGLLAAGSCCARRASRPVTLAGRP